jgi:hypothetical protein
MVLKCAPLRSGEYTIFPTFHYKLGKLRTWDVVYTARKHSKDYLTGSVIPNIKGFEFHSAARVNHECRNIKRIIKPEIII